VINLITKHQIVGKRTKEKCMSNFLVRPGFDVHCG
jgi:hypothetical protein